MEHLTGWAWGLAAICAFMVGLSKTGVPGIGILGVVTLAFAIPAKQSVGLMLIMLVIGDVVAVSWYRRHAVWAHLVRLLPPAFVGLIIGFLLMGQIDDEQLAWTLGWIVIGLLALNRVRDRALGEKFVMPNRWYFAWPIGAAAGITTMLSNAAGPIIFLYFLAMKLDKHEFIGTGAWYFFILNSLKIPFMASLGLITLDSLKVNVVMLPAILLGAAAGLVAFRRIPQKAFGVAIEILTLAAALKLLITPAVWSSMKHWFS